MSQDFGLENQSKSLKAEFCLSQTIIEFLGFLFKQTIAFPNNWEGFQVA